MTPRQQAPLLENGSVPSTDDKLLALLRRLGIEVFPHHETLLIPLERIVVPGAEVIRPSQRLVKSIKQVGILQMPAVELVSGTDLHDLNASWQVIFGRRRVLAARQVGLEVVKCEAYAPGTPQLASLLALIENDQRSVAWIKEVEDLRRLIEEKVGMTPDDLAMFGFDRRTLKERLKIAQLPLPILTAIFAGQVCAATAKKIARLGPSQQEQLADLVLRGETLTAELIKSTLRKQVNAGFVPLQNALAATILPEPSSAAPPVSAPLPSHAPALPVAGVQPTAPSPLTPLAQFLATLKGFERQLIPSAATEPLRLLTRSLIQQLEVAERGAVPILHPTSSEVQEVQYV